MRGNANVITAMAPLDDMFSYVNSLHSMSVGRAMQDHHRDRYRVMFARIAKDGVLPVLLRYGQRTQERSVPRPRFARSRVSAAFRWLFQVRSWNAWDMGWPKFGSRDDDAGR